LDSRAVYSGVSAVLWSFRFFFFWAAPFSFGSFVFLSHFVNLSPPPTLGAPPWGHRLPGFFFWSFPLGGRYFSFFAFFLFSVLATGASKVYSSEGWAATSLIVWPRFALHGDGFFFLHFSPNLLSANSSRLAGSEWPLSGNRLLPPFPSLFTTAGVPSFFF